MVNSKSFQTWWEKNPKGSSEEVISYFEDSARDSVWELNNNEDCPDRDEALDSISTLAEIARYLLRKEK